MPSSGWTKLSDEEVRLAQQWYSEGISPAEVGKRLNRDKSTMTRLLVKQAKKQKQGRPPALSDANKNLLVRRVDELIRKAKGKYRITAKALKKSCKLKVSDKAVLNALHAKDVYFRHLREKPILTQDDVKARFEFAKKYKDKTAAWWNRQVHAYIDGKHFKVYLNGKERDRAAQHATWGAFRTPGKGLDGAYVKPSSKLAHNTGAASCLIMAGVGNGRVLMWHTVAKSRWSGQAAADMYAKPLSKALAKQWPAKRSWTVLEDNDPTGFKSKKGVEAKEAAGIEVFEIPRRSPDLNVCDYALWKEINKRMRRQELKWPKGKRESRQAYVARLRRTALRLPRSFITKSIGNMVTRCKRLYEAKGGHFQEGGR